VGSGHFLVSALNEIISIKSDLRILSGRDGKRLKEYRVEVANDELVVTDEEGDLFEYLPGNNESQRIQEALFHEKQTIIENCLFGVDINPNSVKICRLRLWIELLKNAYYLTPQPPLPRGEGELETLPNIDINIKCGNSLISRYSLDADIKQALKKSKWSIDSYRLAVMTYRNATTKEEKREMERLIDSIKADFETEVAANDKRLVQLKKLNGDLFNLTRQTSLFERTRKEIAAWNKQVNELTVKIKKLETELEELKSNKILENAFEWRFEFPEVLNDDGDFVGFDVVIGNPPYIRQEELGTLKRLLQNNYKVFAGTADILVYFFERGLSVLKESGSLCMITSNKFMKTNYGKNLRNYLKEFQIHKIIDFGELPVFEEAATFPAIYLILKRNSISTTEYTQIKSLRFPSLESVIKENGKSLPNSSFGIDNWTLASADVIGILEKMKANSISLGDVLHNRIFYGIKTGFNEAFLINDVKRCELISIDPKSSEIIFPFAVGDDIRKYQIRNKNRFIILTKIGIEIEKYPAIFNHLKKYKDQLENRWDKGNHWWELRPCSYYELFSQPMIIYPDIAKESRFAFSGGELFFGNTCYFIPSDDLFLLGLLNSRCLWFFYSSIASSLGDANQGGRLRWFTQDVLKIPIPNASHSIKLQIITTVEKILQGSSCDDSTQSFESEIDRLVYELYGLTEEEIRIVEGK
jgi:type II restriction/modification system DNA methylase subunit YeeA